MTHQALRFLLSPEGAQALQDAVLAPDTLAALDRLRPRYGPDIASAAVTTVELRHRAASKFSRAAEMFFTRDGLEMASGEALARSRARRFAPFDAVADLTCGIGGDAVALAAHTHVIAVERDPLPLTMARHNAGVYGVSERFHPVRGDALEWRPDVPAFFADPSRRSEGRRMRRGEDLIPPLSAIVEWARKAQGATLKLSPAFDWEPFRGEAEIELVSSGGECREAVLWFGALKTADVRATLTGAEVSLVSRGAPDPPVRSVGAFIYEPDAAVRRAHLVAEVAEEISAWRLDPKIAYLSADRFVETPFARAWAVREAFPFRLKELNRRLRAAGVGHVVVKKRGVAYDPAEIERRLKLEGDRSAVVFLFRVGANPWAIVGEATSLLAGAQAAPIGNEGG